MLDRFTEDTLLNGLGEVLLQATATPDIVETVRNLLSPRQQNVQNVALVGSKPQPDARANGKLERRKKNTATPVASKNGEGSENSRADKPVLNVQEKVVYATGIINAALQSLSVASRMSSGRPVHSQNGEMSKAHKTIQDGHCRPKNSSSKPLQESCLHKPEFSSKVGEHTVNPSVGKASDICLRATAECAMIAFEFLVTRLTTNPLTRQNDISKSKEVQLLQGMVALGRMLVALGSNELAIKHLKFMRVQLQTQCKKRASSSKITSECTGGRHNQDSLADLLDISEVPEESLETAIDYQMVALKLLGQLRRPIVIDLLVRYLDISWKSSPFILIRTFSRRPDNLEKAARYFESLAQILFSMCPKLSSSDDPIAGDAAKFPNPSTCLKIQSLAFKARLMWIEVAAHRGNVDTEIIKPFVKCLSAFFRRLKNKPSQKYELASQAFSEFSDTIIALRGESNTPVERSSALFDLYLCLSRSAEDAQSYSKAQNWSELMVQECSTSKLPPAKKCVATLKSSAITLRVGIPIRQGQSLCRVVRDASDLLKDGVTGEKADIQMILAEALTLREQVVVLLKTAHESFNGEENHDDYEIIISCREYLTCLVRLILRFSSTSTGANDDKGPLHDPEMAKIFTESAQGSIQSVLFAFKLEQGGDANFWTALDSALQSSLSLLSRLSHQSSREDAETSEYSATYVAVSDLYLTNSFKFANESKLDAGNFSLKSLQRSCESLKHLPLNIHRAGRLGFKFERLGRKLRSLGRKIEANDCFLECLDVAVCSGELEIVSNISSSSSLELFFANPSDLAYVAKALKSVLETNVVQNSGRSTFYDANSVSLELRATLLEWQLTLLSKSRPSNDKQADFAAQVSDLGLLLFRLYEESQYPIRRRRVALQLLRLSADIAPLQTSEALQIARESTIVPGPVENTRDVGLTSFSEHIHTSIMACVALQDSVPSTGHFEQYMNTWMSIVDGMKSPEVLREHIDNLESWISQLRSLSDFFDVQGFATLRSLCLRILLSIFRIETDRSKELVRTLINAGLHQLRIGFSGRAHEYMESARTHLSKIKEPTILLEYHIAAAEYAIAVENDADIEIHLREVRNLTKGCPDVSTDSENTKPTRSVDGIIRVTDSCSVLSDAFKRTGSDVLALKYAKYSVSILQRVWKAFERRNSETAKMNEYQDEENITKLTKDVSDMRLYNKDTTKEMDMNAKTFNGPSFWPLVTRLYRALLRLANLCSNLGQFQECYYEIEQAQKLAESVRSPHLIALVETYLGELECRSGNVEEGREHINKAGAIHESMEMNVDMALHHVVRGYSHQLRSEWQAEFDAYDAADKVIEMLAANDLAQTSNSVDCSLQNQLPHVQAAGSGKNLSARNLKQPKRSKKPRKPSPIESNRHDCVTCPSSTDFMVAYARLAHLRSKEKHQKAQSLITQGKLDAATALLGDIDLLRIDPTMRTRQISLYCSKLLQEAFEMMSKDAVYGILPDSVLSFPAVLANPCQNTSNAFRSTSFEQTLIKRRNVDLSLDKAAKPEVSGSKPFVHCLRDALTLASRDGTPSSEPYTLFSLTKLCSSFVTASILLSFSQPSTGFASVNPASIAYTIELPRTVAFVKERALIVAQNEKMQNLDESLLSFPDEQALKENVNVPPLECFEENVIGKIPENWTVISMTIDEDKSHLYIVKYETKKVPFLLRLPLNRQNVEDPEEEAFTFRDAKAELLDIISRSDDTVHRAREQPEEMKVKGAKSQWWSEREDLDARLKNLLVNIENVWFGGFCGVLSNTTLHESAHSKFQTDFDAVLDKHLPSRQTLQKRGKGHKVVPGSQVVSLFTGINSSSGREFDADEALTDLLYFVVDILQFNGEANAYDEIDFDAMIVETQDALQRYHDTAGSSPTNQSDRHTILILDKELHAFPWESLPCIDGQSISRLTSMTELCERIRMIEDQTYPSDNIAMKDGILSSAMNGNFILNPSGDLSKTQSRFQKALSTLTDTQSNWSQIIARAPSEDEFFNTLTNKSAITAASEENQKQLPRVLLYFGHGSGAQYIRSRRIKRLCTSTSLPFQQSTSTALLFGCSSASLREAGIFEPYGPLRAYLQAGAPAVLGSLWDVTDGDVDAFAMGVLRRWGLLGAQENGPHPFETPGRGRKKGKGAKAAGGRRRVEEVEEQPKKGQTESKTMSLSDAVARSRDECYLRYLNGASMVVYGVPVYLASAPGLRI